MTQFAPRGNRRWTFISSYDSEKILELLRKNISGARNYAKCYYGIKSFSELWEAQTGYDNYPTIGELYMNQQEQCEHNYSTETCQSCNSESCYDCAANNRAESPGPERAYFICPHCGYNIDAHHYGQEQ